MAEAVGSFLVGAGLGTGLSALGEMARFGITYAKWKGTSYDAKYNRIAELLQQLLDAEKNEVSGLSSKGAVECIYNFIDKTLDFAWFIDETIATQLWVQMIQQSVAYAIHSSHAGSIGTIGNVYSGSMYLGGAEASNVGESSEFLSRGLRGFLSAEVGQNIPTITFNLLRGANRRIEDVYRSILRQMDSLLDEWNDLTLNYYRHYHTMCRERFADAIKMKETATDRAYSLLEQIANEHLARIVEQYDSLEGAKSWYNSKLMESTELSEIALRIDLEVKASEQDYDEHKEAILKAISTTVEEWDVKIDQALGDLTDSEYRFCLLVRQIFDEVFLDVTDFVKQVVDMCNESVTDVCAYRNVKPSVEIVVHDPVVVAEVKPEVDVSRLYYRRYSEIEESIIVREYTALNVIRWEDVTAIPVIEVAEPEYNAMEKRRYEQVSPYTVVYPYDSVPFVSCVQVG